MILATALLFTITIYDSPRQASVSVFAKLTSSMKRSVSTDLSMRKSWSHRRMLPPSSSICSPSTLTHVLFADATTYETTYKHAKSFNNEIEWLPEPLKYSFIREMIPGLLADLKEGK
jgi:hypothetical protein